MEIVIANTDIAHVASDLLVLKHADGFYGADRAVANAIGFEGHIQAGQCEFCSGAGVAAPEVVFIGVGPLPAFRYRQIQDFGKTTVKLASRHSRPIHHLAMTAHGPGYGLDPEQAFLSLVAGLAGEWQASETSLAKITIAELSAKRCELFARILDGAREKFGLQQGSAGESVIVQSKVGPARAGVADNIVHFGEQADLKPRLFVAMPFADEFLDEFHIGFCEAARASSFICERLDISTEAFTGDIVGEIKRRILGSQGVLALLNSHNPNVFLEIGFAFAHNKPTILVARQGVNLPFDVSGHRCIRYSNITGLRVALTREIASLKAQGVLAKSA